MPRIITIPPSRTGTATVKLDKEGLVVDERVIGLDIYRKCKCRIEGRTLTVTEIDKFRPSWQKKGWKNIYVRIYDPEIEDVPDLKSKSYRYHGLENERAPYDVEEVTVDDSVTVIKIFAFSDCEKMKRCIMGDQVVRIGFKAFNGCKKIKSIRLSRSLEIIEAWAFTCCYSIECLFLPPNVNEIEHNAFGCCDGMKVIVLPSSIDVERVGEAIVCECPILNGSLQYGQRFVNNRQVNHWLKHRYDDLPLIRLCADPDVTAQMIQDYKQANGTAAFHQADDTDKHALLPLHILTSCHVTHGRKNAIVACYDANPSALLTPNSEGKTPLENLWENEGDGKGGNIDVIVHLVKDLCITRLIA